MKKQINYNYDHSFYDYTMAEIIDKIGINEYAIMDSYFIPDLLIKIKEKYNIINHYRSIMDYKNVIIDNFDDDVVNNKRIDHCILSYNFAITFSELKDNMGQKDDEILNVHLYFRDNFDIEQVVSFVSEYEIKLDDEPKSFYTIGIDHGEYILEKNTINEYDYNIDVNYGSDFNTHHKKILSCLEKRYGLLLFYGDPGCGKTMYIRYLITQYSNKKNIVYLPSYMIEHLSNPDLITFIKRYKNTLLILEDAEHALLDRSVSHSSAVSNLLNITCGLLNDITEIQIVATFNTNKNNIDKALLREGRLLYEYKFEKLSVEDGQKVAKNLDLDIEITEEMSLAEIYNFLDYTKNKEKNTNTKTIGFKR